MGLFDKFRKAPSQALTVKTDAPEQPRGDDWQNCFSGINTARDRRTFGSFVVADRMTPQEGEDLWRQSDMAATIVETLPDQMTAEGFDVMVESDGDEDETDGDGKEQQEAMECALEDLNAEETLNYAMKVARAMGGSAIFLGVDGGIENQLELPLDPNKIGSIDFMYVLNPKEIWPMYWYTDIKDPKFGLPSIYAVQRQSTGGGAVSPVFYIHESRLIRFEGIKTSRFQQSQNRSWGDPVLYRVGEVLRDFDMNWASAASLLSDFAQGVFKIAGLAEAIAGNQANVVQDRMKAIDFSRSVLRSVVLDAEEDFERKATPLSGYPEMLDRFCNRLAAAARLPVSLLMGQAPAGLNATGDAELRWFFKAVKAEQKRVYLPALKRLIKLLFLSKRGPTNGVEPENWSVEFRPLWTLSDAEEATMRFQVAQADQIYIANQVLMPEEVAQSRFGGDQYSMETQLDADLRDKMLGAHELEQMPADELVPNAAKGASELNQAQQMAALAAENQNNQHTSTEGTDAKPSAKPPPKPKA